MSVAPPADMDGAVIFPSGCGMKRCSRLYEDKVWDLGRAVACRDGLSQNNLEVELHHLREAGHLARETITFEYDPKMELAGRIQSGMAAELGFGPKSEGR